MNLVKNKTSKAPCPKKVPCPQGRISRPTKEHDGRQIVDISTYIPYFLSAVNNALTRGASSQYLNAFGVGIVEWRIISMLAIEPRIPASRMCEVIYLDKSGTSRALKRLKELNYLEYDAPAVDPRRKIWWLNTNGYDLHDRILEAALARERKLIVDVEPGDLEVFLRVVRQMRKNVDRL